MWYIQLTEQKIVFTFASSTTILDEKPEKINFYPAGIPML
jgi:hypothetical protein